jgi:ribosomal protein S18 acetylase RimI-like enzyme
MTTTTADMAALVEGLTVPAGLIRAGVDDAQRVYALQAEHERRLTGEVTETVEDACRELEQPGGIHWLLPGPDGQVRLRLAAFSHAGNEHVFVSLIADEGVDDETGRSVLAFGLDAARRLDPAKPVHCGALDADSRTLGWLEAAGGVVVRRFGRMDIDIDPADPPADPELPPGVTLRTVEDTDDDWRILHRVVDKAFSDHFGHVEQSFEDFIVFERSWVDDYSLVWVASVDGEPAAALIGKQRPGDGYIGVLGTLQAYRGRNLARTLLRTAFAEFARRGEKRASLNVDLTNPTGAVHVYTSVGMRHSQTFIAYEFPGGTAAG